MIAGLGRHWRPVALLCILASAAALVATLAVRPAPGVAQSTTIPPETAVDRAVKHVQGGSPGGRMTGAPTSIRGKLTTYDEAETLRGLPPLSPAEGLWQQRDLPVWLIAVRGDSDVYNEVRGTTHRSQTQWLVEIDAQTAMVWGDSIYPASREIDTSTFQPLSLPTGPVPAPLITPGPAPTPHPPATPPPLPPGFTPPPTRVTANYPNYGLVPTAPAQVTPTGMTRPVVRPQAGAQASLSLVPSVPSAVAGQGFSVDVVLDSNVATRGAQVGLGFDPTRLRAEGWSEGPYYADWAKAHGGTTIVIPPPATDNRGGTVSTSGIAILGGEPSGPSGQGVLVTYRFTALVDGVKPLEALSMANPEVVDAQAMTIGLSLNDGSWAGGAHR